MFVCILPEKAVPEMTYSMSGGTLNPTYSLTWRSTSDMRQNRPTLSRNQFA